MTDDEKRIVEWLETIAAQFRMIGERTAAIAIETSVDSLKRGEHRKD